MSTVNGGKLKQDVLCARKLATSNLKHVNVLVFSPFSAHAYPITS